MPEDLPQDQPLDRMWLMRVIDAALDEDLGGRPGRDVTTFATVSPHATGRAVVVMRSPGVIAGVDVIEATLDAVARRYELPLVDSRIKVTDGQELTAGDTIAVLRGSTRVILVAERTILNVLSRASGVATHTRRWVQALEGTTTRIVDTRKTNPGLRALDKYAVRCGGGTNKRIGLYDCAMIKDNHIAAVGSVTEAIRAVHQAYPDVPVQVEVDSAEQAREALAAGCTFLMLDNMSPADMSQVVAEIRTAEPTYGAVQLEATGGITLANAAEVAATGVDFVSVGALTHSSPIVDIALDIG